MYSPRISSTKQTPKRNLHPSRFSFFFVAWTSCIYITQDYSYSLQALLQVSLMYSPRISSTKLTAKRNLQPSWCSLF